MGAILPLRRARLAIWRDAFWPPRQRERGVFRRTAAALAGVLLIAACQQEEPLAPQIRPVRTVTVQHTNDSDPISLTGEIQSRDQVNLGFRLDGRLVERSVSVGMPVAEGQVIARLDADDVQNALRSATANLSAAEAILRQAKADEARQRELFNKGIVAKARLEQAEQTLQSATAQVEAAEAQVQSAEDSVGYTELRADATGTVTATGAEPGEVVRAGQMIVQVAREGGKDAVFHVPAQMIREAPRDPLVTVVLADDPAIVTTGRVREVSPQADAATGTFVVKVGLSEPPATMRLGDTIIGSISLNAEPVVRLPATALTEIEGQPAVWIVDASTLTVAAREVEVLRYDSDVVIIGGGLADGEVVVTAGVHALQPGQQVRLLGESS
jgi:membrane fusion protein, multidrug efflux system